MSSFKNVRIVDNFYQSSCFFPMPLTLIGTMDENGKTSFGAYSLVFPYYIAGKDHYTMILECRNTSNTARGLLRHGKCTINFLPYSKKIFSSHVDLGFPGDTPDEKMKKFPFHVEEGLMKEEHPEENFPLVISEAYQVMECSWWKELDNAQDDQILDEYEGPYHNFNGITSKFGTHFILKVDKIIMKEKYADAIIYGVNRRNFGPLPTNWGYRDSKYFWCSGYRKPDAVGIPSREVDLASVRFAAERCDDKIRFADDALAMLTKIPRPFLKAAIMGCIKWAKENNCELITEKEMKIINDKRKEDKKGNK